MIDTQMTSGKHWVPSVSSPHNKYFLVEILTEAFHPDPSSLHNMAPQLHLAGYGLAV